MIEPKIMYSLKGRNKYYPERGEYFFSYERGRYSHFEITIDKDGKARAIPIFSEKFNEWTAAFETIELAKQEMHQWLDLHYLPENWKNSHGTFSGGFQIDPASVKIIEVTDLCPVRWEERFVLKEINNED